MNLRVKPDTQAMQQYWPPILAALICGLMTFHSVNTYAASLEEQMNSLEKSVMTVEQRRKAALHDLNVNVIQAYRDAIKINSVDTSIAEVFERTARVKVSVSYSIDFDAAKKVKASLSQYFRTGIDKADGVEPYGMIYTELNDCVGQYCAVKTDASKFLRSTAVGINVSILGEWQPGILMDGSGRYDLKPGRINFLVDVPKSKIKGDPKPQVKSQIYDVHYCDGSSPCHGVTFSMR